MWVHCPRASNGLLPRRSNLVGYVRWDAQSDRFPPCQTIIPTAFRSQSGLPVIQAQSGEAAADQLRRSSLLRVAHIARDGRITRQSSISQCLPTVAEGAWTKCRRPRTNMAYLNARLEAIGTPLVLFTA